MEIYHSIIQWLLSSETLSVLDLAAIKTTLTEIRQQKKVVLNQEIDLSNPSQMLEHIEESLRACMQEAAATIQRNYTTYSACLPARTYLSYLFKWVCKGL